VVDGEGLLGVARKVRNVGVGFEIAPYMQKPVDSETVDREREAGTGDRYVVVRTKGGGPGTHLRRNPSGRHNPGALKAEAHKRTSGTASSGRKKGARKESGQRKYEDTSGTCEKVRRGK